MYNKTTQDVIDAMNVSTTLEDYMTRLESDQHIIAVAKELTDGRLYGGNIADYIFPVMLSAQHVERAHCKDLIQEGKAVLRRLTNFVTWMCCQMF